MSPPDARRAVRNAAICGVLGVVGLVVMALEGYLRKVDLAFAIFGSLVVVVATATARRLSTPRCLTLFGVAGLFGLVTQSLGTRLGAWQYTNAARTYFFVFFAFGFGSLCNVGIARALAARLRPALPRLLAFALLVAIAGYGTLTFGVAPPFAPSTVFVAYYVSLLVAAFLVARAARASTVVPLIVVSACYGVIAESLGARSDLWVFAPASAPFAAFPPLWLVLVSWPLETVLHFGLSAAIAREPIESS